ncbi:MAG: Verru_Chthon cassette protein D [Verrucomicrobiota bacterium]
MTKLDHYRSTRGFSLIEMLLVLTVMLVLLGMIATVSNRTITSHRLGALAATLQADLNYGFQLADTHNRPVEFRIYQSEDLTTGRSPLFTAYQLLHRSPKTGKLIELTSVTLLDEDIAFHSSMQFSSLMSLGKNPPSANDPKVALDGDRTDRYQFTGFQLRPDGSTSLAGDQIWTLTLVTSNEASSLLLPRNYRTLAINPASGSVRLYD